MLGCLQRAHEVLHVALHGGLADVADGCDAHVPPVAALAGHRVERVILRKANAVLAARANRWRLSRAVLVAGHTVHEVRVPTDLAELAVADHVDADRVLLLHGVGHGPPQGLGQGALVQRLARLLGLGQLHHLRRPNQAADMRGHVAVAAALHHSPPWVLHEHTPLPPATALGDPPLPDGTVPRPIGRSTHRRFARSTHTPPAPPLPVSGSGGVISITPSPEDRGRGTGGGGLNPEVDAAGQSATAAVRGRVPERWAARSKRSRFMTLSHAATKS